MNDFEIITQNLFKKSVDLRICIETQEYKVLSIPINYSCVFCPVRSFTKSDIDLVSYPVADSTL